jgi:hypothetical protein
MQKKLAAPLLLSRFAASLAICPTFDAPEQASIMAMSSEQQQLLRSVISISS